MLDKDRLAKKIRQNIKDAYEFPYYNDERLYKFAYAIADAVVEEFKQYAETYGRFDNRDYTGRVR